MAYRVEVLPQAKADIDEAYSWLLARTPQHAPRWLTGLEKAIAGRRSEQLVKFQPAIPAARTRFDLSRMLLEHVLHPRDVLFGSLLRGEAGEVPLEETQGMQRLQVLLLRGRFDLLQHSLGPVAQPFFVAQLVQVLASGVRQNASLVAPLRRQAAMVETEQVQERGMEIVRVHGILGDAPAQVVGFAQREAALHAGAAEPDGEGVRMVIAAGAIHVVALRDGGPAELRAAHHKG